VPLSLPSRYLSVSSISFSAAAWAVEYRLRTAQYIGVVAAGGAAEREHCLSENAQVILWRAWKLSGRRNNARPKAEAKIDDIHRVAGGMGGSVGV